MTDGDPRLASALRRQLARRPDAARRVGWKVGRGDRERIGGEIVVGHLTSATLLEPGGSYGSRDAGCTHVMLEMWGERRHEQIRLFGEKVLPQFRRQ